MNKKMLNLAIVGATGLVGRAMKDILEERNFPINNIKLLASARSAGTVIDFRSKKIIVEELNENSFENIDISLFSAGATVSEKYAPIAVESNSIVIDNGSFWRMNENVPLIVPEVNLSALQNHHGLIANPNCSTIQLVIPIHIISKINKIKRIVVATYQAISGGGQKLLDKFHSEMNGISNNNKNKIFNNLTFHTPFNSEGNSNEEEKIMNETRKILDFSELNIAATCVRIPIENSHSISVNVEFAEKIKFDEIKNALSNSKNVIFVESNSDDYPSPTLSNGKDEVFVGRLRRDYSVENGLYLWIVADNLRKGAATNAVQIAEYILENNLFNFKKVQF